MTDRLNVIRKYICLILLDSSFIVESQRYCYCKKMDYQAVFIATTLNLTCHFTTTHVIWQSINLYTANR